MNTTLPTAGQHWLEMYIALQLYSALVQSLPAPPADPKTVGGITYKSVYNFLSIVGTDFKSFMASKTAAGTAAGSDTISPSISERSIQTSGQFNVANKID
jgi:hypothetical protein